MINQVQEAEATIASFSTSGTIISDSISTYVDELWISVISHAVAIGTLVPTAEASSTDTSNGEVIESMVPANSGKSSYATTSTVRVEVRGSSSLGTGGVDTLTTDRMRVNSIMEELFTRTEKPEAFSTTKSTESRVTITSTVTNEQKETVTRALSGQTSPTSLICGNPTDLPGRSDADPQFVRTSSFDWCFLPAVQGFMQAGDECVIDVKRSSDDVLYEYSICWAVDCVGEPQAKRKPLGEDGPKCEDILYEDCWQACRNNEGMGGQVQAGCLVYKVRTGVGKSQGYSQDGSRL
ncbi:hypothetical protein BFJ63_vAg18039 [Fusarium oxysporum f. sp. narcissi]|uniref:Uncharacterized protein n=1 Tax=Fusarium oxysporum f. sp. narcissi TaxID=451672 RepID=A0A4Q2V445_FUSOX|nr:hypothetical protein BFJ63_vAg18039 [Fusarium oxysporum f. sp. narcissi]